jgi:hypothetical protein
MQTLFGVWSSIQKWLFPVLEDELGELCEVDREFVRVVELCDLPSHLARYSWRGLGRRRESRLCLAKAFMAKSIHKIADRTALIRRLHADPKLRRLCGWETQAQVPSEPTFCRAFAEFAAGGLAQAVHEAMVRRHASPEIVGHVSRDSTAIAVREKPTRKPLEPKAGCARNPRGQKSEVRGQSKPLHMIAACDHLGCVRL